MQGWQSQKGLKKSVVIDNLPQVSDTNALWEDLSYFLNNPNVYFENLAGGEDMHAQNGSNGAGASTGKGKGKKGKGGDDGDESPGAEAAKKKSGGAAKRVVGKIDFDSQADAMEFCHATDAKLFVNEEHYLRCAVV